MSAHDVQREIDVTSNSDVSGVGLSFRYVLLWTSFLAFLCPATKSGGVLCYTLRTFECLSVRLSVRPSVRQRLIIRVRSITLIPFEIISRNLAQI